jgi:hypothetical protein
MTIVEFVATGARLCGAYTANDSCHVSQQNASCSVKYLTQLSTGVDLVQSL